MGTYPPRLEFPFILRCSRRTSALSNPRGLEKDGRCDIHTHDVIPIGALCPGGQLPVGGTTPGPLQRAWKALDMVMLLREANLREPHPGGTQSGSLLEAGLPLLGNMMSQHLYPVAAPLLPSLGTQGGCDIGP